MNCQEALFQVEYAGFTRKQDLILVISTPGSASVSAHRKGETFGPPGPGPGGDGVERMRLSKDAESLAEVTRPLGGERG